MGPPTPPRPPPRARPWGGGAAGGGRAREPAPAAVRTLAVSPPVLPVGRWLVAAVAVVGLGWGLATVAGQTPPADEKAPPAEKEKAPVAAEVVEPLPAGALVRFGTTRYRASSGFWF